MLYLRRVQGKSLEPHYRSGQLVLCLRQHKLKTGQIALFAHEGREKLKIITDKKQDQIFVEGASRYSSDSRDFGWIEVSSIKAVVVWPRFHRL